MTVDDLFGLERRGIERGLSRIRKLVDLLDHPERSFPIVHIAGTNGKGSTAAMIATILERAGYRVGLYTSPHLERWTERIQIDREEASETELLSDAERLWPWVEREGVTYYELTTALAFHHFARHRVDIAVVEVGLGGRWDATNVVQPIVTVITSIGIDHTEYLGENLREIAQEKAGIMKQEVPCVVADKDCALVEVFREKAEGLGVELRIRGVDFEEIEQNYKVRLKGEHQKENASLAVEVCRLLTQQDFAISEEAIERGLSEVVWPGRFEVFEGPSPIVLDVAHNREGIQALLKTLRLEYKDRPVVFLFGVSKEKAVQEMISEIRRYSPRIVFTEARNRRAAKTEELLSIFPEAIAVKHSQAALQKGLQLCGSEGILSVCGSIFLVGELKSHVRSLSSGVSRLE